MNTKVDRYIGRRIASTSLVALLLLSLLFFCYTLATLVSDEIISHLDQSILLQMSGIRMLIAIPQLLPTAYYFGVVLALNRLNRDSELLVLSALGWSDWRLARAVFSIGLIIALFLAVAVHWLRPWSYDQFAKLRGEIVKTNQIAQIPPGTFVSLLDGEWVISSQSRDDATKQFINVFLHQKTDFEKRMITASAGSIEKPDTDTPYLIELKNGHIYTFNETDQIFRKSSFDEMAFTINERTPESLGRHLRAKSTTTLARAEPLLERSEFHWRLSLPIGFILLVLLTVPISKGHPRRGGNVALITATVIYTLVYYSFNVLGEWIEQGVIEPLPGYWWLWLALALVAVALYNRIKI